MKRIMAVDDSSTMLRIISNMLKYEGFEVITADSGEKALSILSGDHEFNVIITDINMAEMNGIELTLAIRGINEHKNTPIIIVTTDDSGSDREAGEEAGATGWLIKPFITDSLMSAVNGVSQQQ